MQPYLEVVHFPVKRFIFFSFESHIVMPLIQESWNCVCAAVAVIDYMISGTKDSSRDVKLCCETIPREASCFRDRLVHSVSTAGWHLVVKTWHYSRRADGSSWWEHCLQIIQYFDHKGETEPWCLIDHFLHKQEGCFLFLVNSLNLSLQRPKSKHFYSIKIAN